MKAIITVQGRHIQVQLAQHAVRITTDDELRALLRHQIRTSTNELVMAIKTAYQKQMGFALQVSNRSMSVEIWGHVYSEQVAKWIQRFIRIKFIDIITGKIIFHAKQIDIGERGYDNNRFVWDALSPFLSVIALFLP